MSESRRRFDSDFKQGAVQIVLDTGRPISEIARELGVHPGTLGKWVDKRRAAQASGPGVVSEDERTELVRLRKENAELRMQRDVLKRSVVLWVDEAMGRKP
jgi:transposase